MSRPLSLPETALFEQHYQKVFKSVYLFCKDYHGAEDATQEAFFIAFKKIHQLKSLASFTGWVYVIAINLLKKKFAKDKRTPLASAEHIESFVGKNQDYHQVELNEIILQLLDTLPEEERNILILHYIHDHSINQIAELLQIKPATLKVKLHRIRNKLRQRNTLLGQELMEERV